MNEKLTDEELRKAQRQNWIKLANREFYVFVLFAAVILVYLAARNGIWWLLCGGTWFLATCVFVYSLCFISQSSDERLGLNEWQQGERNEPQKQ